MTSTNYFFAVGADALEGALDRFAGFFYEPLFNEDCTEREIKAVDSEHKKNLQSDMWASLAECSFNTLMVADPVPSVSSSLKSTFSETTTSTTSLVPATTSRCGRSPKRPAATRATS